MPTLKVPLNNFQFGEVSPSLSSRTDTPLYNNSAEQVRNFWIRAEGGLKRRAGTEFHSILGDYETPQAEVKFDNSNTIEDGSQIKFTLNDGTVLTAQYQTSSNNARIGNTFFLSVRNVSGQNNNALNAERLRDRINASGVYSSLNDVPELTASIDDSYSITWLVNRTASGGEKLTVDSTDSARARVTDFRVPPIQFRLEPFVFSDDEMYLVAFSHQNIKCFRIRSAVGSIISTINPTGDMTWLNNTMDKPYVNELTFAQQGDIMFIAHPTHMIKTLTRTGLSSFEVDTFNFDTSFNNQDIYQPYFSFQPQGVRAEINGNQASQNKQLVIKNPSGVDNNPYPYFSVPAFTSTSQLTINQVVSGNVYQIVHAQSSSIADFQLIGAPTSDVGLIFQATANGASQTFSSTTGQLAFVTTSDPTNPTQNVPHLGTNIMLLGSRLTITALDLGNTGQHRVGTQTAYARVTIHKDVETKLPVDSLATNQNSSIITVTQALHGLSGGSVFISDAASIGGIGSGNINGTQNITVIDDNTYTFDVNVNGNQNATSSTIGGGTPTMKVTTPISENWQEQSYSPVYGYPHAITFHQNRLWFAGSLGQPDGIWASKSGQYFNFDIGDGEDNDSIDITTSVGEINQILHLVSNRDLQVFTAGSELYVRSPSNQAITPSNAQILKQTPFGADYVRPIPFDGATLFMQHTGTALREFLFTDAENAYTSVAVSALAPHLIRHPVQQTVIAGALDRSENYSFLVNRDGTIAVFYSVRGDKKAGWSLWDTQGTWDSICAVRDHLYAVAVRDRGDGTLRCSLEHFRSDYPLDYATVRTATGTNGGAIDNLNSIDSTYRYGTTYNIPKQFDATAVVDVVNVNDHLGQFTVSGGAINVSSAKTNVRNAFVGFPYFSIVKTLPVDAQLANGPLTGEPREISRVIVDFNTTLSANIKAPSTSSTARDLVVSAQTTDHNPQKIPFTGKKEFRTLGYERDPRVIVSQTIPLDLQINGMIVEVAY